MTTSTLPPLVLELRAQATEALASMKEVETEAAKLGTSAEAGTSKAQAGFNKLASVGKAAAVGLVGGAVAIAAEGVKMATEMSESDAKIAGSAQLPIAAAKQIGDAFLDTAGQSTFSGKEMADAFGPIAGVVKQLAGGTLDAASSMKFMSAANDLAEASGQDLTTVTSSLATTLQAYGLKVGDAADASNTLYNTSRLTGVGLDSISTAATKLHGRLGIAAPDLQTTGALMLDLSEHGITGSKGVMVVQTAMSTLLGGTKAVNTELGTLGVSVFDSSGKFVGMGSVISQLQPKLLAMNDAQRQQALTSLFGASAATAMSSTILGGASAYDKAAKAVSTTDAVQKAAEDSADSLAGQVKKLHAGFDDIVTLLGEKLVPIITSTVSWFAQHKTVTIALAGVIAGALVAAITAYIAKITFAAAESVGKFAVMIAGWAGLGPAAATAAAGTTAAMGEVEVAEDGLVATSEASGVAVDAAFGPIGLAIAAIVLAATLLVTHWKQVWGDIKQWIGDAASFISDHSVIIAGALTVLLGPLGLVLGAALLLATHWKQVWSDVTQWLSDAVDFIEKYSLEISGALVVLLGPLGLVLGAALLLATHWNEVWSAMSDAIKVAWNDVLKPTFGFIKTVAIEPTKVELSLFKTVWSDTFSAIKSVTSGAYNGVIHPIMSAISTVINGVRSVISEFGTIWDDIWNGVSGAVEDAWNYISPIVSEIQNAVSTISGAVGTVSGIVGDVGSFFGFADGGPVPGAVGAPMAAIVHGGEYMLSHDMLTGGAPIDPAVVGAVLANVGKNSGTGAALSQAATYGSAGGYNAGAGGTAAAGGGSQSSVVELHTHLMLDGKEIADSVQKHMLRTGLRRGVSYQNFVK